jgi:acyl dehydratase
MTAVGRAAFSLRDAAIDCVRLGEASMASLVLPNTAALREHVGQKLGTSDWVEVTQRRIDLFAEATGDHQWIHVDSERARRDSPFGTTIAHGHLTLSLAPMLLQQILEIGNLRLIVNPGVEHIRLRSPVRCGDKVRMHASLKEVRNVPGGVRATMSVSFEVEGQKKPAAFGDMLLVYYDADGKPADDEG